jgi:hypothetical protein
MADVPCCAIEVGHQRKLQGVDFQSAPAFRFHGLAQDFIMGRHLPVLIFTINGKGCARKVRRLSSACR